MASQPQSQQDLGDWLVQVPLRDLLALQRIAQGESEAMKAVANLERRIEGLSNIMNDVMQAFGDLKREVKGR